MLFNLTCLLFCSGCHSLKTNSLPSPRWRLWNCSQPLVDAFLIPHHIILLKTLYILFKLTNFSSTVESCSLHSEKVKFLKCEHAQLPPLIPLLPREPGLNPWACNLRSLRFNPSIFPTHVLPRRTLCSKSHLHCWFPNAPNIFPSPWLLFTMFS